MLAWTDWLVGADPDANTCYEELRTLASQSGDVLSLAMGTAGRAFALCENEHRPAEAAALADEVLQMIDDVHCDRDAESRPAVLGDVGEISGSGLSRHPADR